MATKTKKKTKKKAAVKKTAVKKKGNLHAWLRDTVKGKPSIGVEELQERAIKEFGKTATIRNHFKTVTYRTRKLLVDTGAIKKDAWKTNGTPNAKPAPAAKKKKAAPVKKKVIKAKEKKRTATTTGTSASTSS